MTYKCNMFLTSIIIVLLSLIASTCYSAPPPTAEVLAKASAYVKGLQNVDGGWPLTQGGESDVEETAFAIQALLFTGGGSGSEVIQKGLDYLKKLQGEDGDWNANPAHTAFVIMALWESGHDKNIFNALGWLRKKAQNPDGSWAKSADESATPSIPSTGVIAYTGVVLTSMKRVNLYADTYTPAEKGVKWLLDVMNEDGAWGMTKKESSNVLATSWAIQGLAIATTDYAYTIETSLKWLKTNQNGDGGFGMIKGQSSDPELTAYAILALVAGNDLSNAAGNARRYLRTVQQKYGSYVSATPIELDEPSANVQTTCFVIWALMADKIRRKK